MENTFSTPNSIVDRLMGLLTPEENTVLFYAIRRTRGFQKSADKISMRQFTEGTVSSSGEHYDYGTGLGLEAVKKALDALNHFRILLRKEGRRRCDGTFYELQVDQSMVDWVGLEARLEDRREAQRKRTAGARGKRGAKAQCSVRQNIEGTSVPQNINDPQSSVAQNIQCSVPQSQVVLSDRTTKERERQGERKHAPSERASASGAPRKKPPDLIAIGVTDACRFYSRRFQEVHPDLPSPVITGQHRGKLRAIFQELVSAYDRDYQRAQAEFERVLDLFLRDDHRGVVEAGWDLTALSWRFNGLRSGANGRSGQRTAPESLDDKLARIEREYAATYG